MNAALKAQRVLRPTQSSRGRGTVTAVNAGPPATLTVAIEGASLNLRYLGSGYSISDEVIVDKRDRDWIVLGKLA